jgi:hypothetical protein
MSDDAAEAGLVVTGQNGRLALCSTPYTCASSPLYTRPERVGAFMAELGRASSTLLLTGLDPDTPAFAGALTGLKQAGLATHCFRGWTNWYETVEGCDFAAYMKRRPAALRNTLARKHKKLESACAVEFRLDADTEEFTRAYEKVYRASWKEPEPFAGFMPALIGRMATLGALRSGILLCDGEPAAAQFWLVWRGRATIFKLAHDEKWAAYSVGSLLTQEMARSVLEKDRPAEIDFGRGDDPYKKLWLSQRRDRYGIEAANPRRLGGFARSMRIALQNVRHRLAGVRDQS